MAKNLFQNIGDFGGNVAKGAGDVLGGVANFLFVSPESHKIDIARQRLALEKQLFNLKNQENDRKLNLDAEQQIKTDFANLDPSTPGFENQRQVLLEQAFKLPRFQEMRQSAFDAGFLGQQGPPSPQEEKDLFGGLFPQRPQELAPSTFDTGTGITQFTRPDKPVPPRNLTPFIMPSGEPVLLDLATGGVTETELPAGAELASRTKNITNIIDSAPGKFATIAEAMREVERLDSENPTFVFNVEASKAGGFNAVPERRAAMDVGTAKDIVLRKNMVRIAGDIIDLYDPDFVGPIEGGIKGKAKEFTGLISPDEAAFRIKVNKTIISAYADSGKQLAVQEMKRLEQFLPTLGKPPEVFEASMVEFIENLEQGIENAEAISGFSGKLVLPDKEGPKLSDIVKRRFKEARDKRASVSSPAAAVAADKIRSQAAQEPPQQRIERLQKELDALPQPQSVQQVDQVSVEEATPPIQPPTPPPSTLKKSTKNQQIAAKSQINAIIKGKPALQRQVAIWRQQTGLSDIGILQLLQDPKILEQLGIK